MLAIGDKINSKHFGEGTLLSFENNNQSARILFPCGEKLLSVFALTATPMAKPSKSRGQKRRERDAKERAAFAMLPNAEKIENQILWINGTVIGDHHSGSYKIVGDMLERISDKAMATGNEKIAAICETIMRTMRASERQAYVLAQFADQNKIAY